MFSSKKSLEERISNATQMFKDTLETLMIVRSDTVSQRKSNEDKIVNLQQDNSRLDNLSNDIDSKIEILKKLV